GRSGTIEGTIGARDGRACPLAVDRCPWPAQGGHAPRALRPPLRSCFEPRTTPATDNRQLATHLPLRRCAGGMSPTVRGPVPKIHQSSRNVRPTNGPLLASSSPVSAQ